MEKKTLEIHSENILPIIKKWLYSDRDIFARELVSNACDALHKVKILRDQGEAEAQDEEFRIDIQIDKENKRLIFSDTGLGMDAEEVQKYIAQIAFSSAEEFVEKYKSDEEGDQFIGHFGLGFYSAYMVADKVEIETLSYKKGAEPVFWACDGSHDYIIDKGTRDKRGTAITLHIGEEHKDFLEESQLRQTLGHYCAFLPYPVYLGEQQINTHEPLWIKSPNETTDEEYLEFYRHLYPMQEDPLFWIHLNVDYPFNLKGILYFPKIRREMDIEKNTVKLYCNRVFVSDNCKDVIPNYLMALQGVIDSPDIPLNVSRSYLQMDRTVKQLGGHISKKVADSLGALFKQDKERFLACWEDVSLVVKLGILEDDKFYERVKGFLVWKNAQGAWMTVEEYLEKNREKTGEKILYTRDEHHLPQLLDLYRNKEIDVLSMHHPVDSYAMQFLERKITPAKFQRLDGALNDALLDKEREKTVLDDSGKTESGKLADFIRSKLNNDTIEVEAKSLAAEALPGMVVFDEEQRRMRDYMLQLDPKQGSMAQMLGKKRFVVNTNHSLFSMIQKIDQLDAELAKEMVQQLYDSALLSQREMAPEQLNAFMALNGRVVEKLAELAAKDS